MSTFVDKPLSLIERKKQQWAKEREELAGLYTTTTWTSIEEPSFTRRYETRMALDYSSNQTRREPRRSSLPPLYKNQYNSTLQYHQQDTSGYGSDFAPNQQSSGYESCSSFRDDRPRWGKQDPVTTSDPPNWVKRGLEDGEIQVTNTSPAESPQQQSYEDDRPCTGSSCSQTRSFIRGQNIPVDSVELAERERRRQVAMAHQEAIRLQLEDREKRRQAEKERRIKEEHEEELRIEREKEIERQRLEAEQQALKEKQQRDLKRKEAIQEAVKQAEREALQQKSSRIKRNIPEPKPIISEEIQEPVVTIQETPEEELKGEALIIKNQENPAKKNFEFDPHNVQYALIMPVSSSFLENNIIEARTENRVLTPSLYRLNKPKQFCDSSTQTDSLITEATEKFRSLDIRKQRSRCESVEDRPKWNANRPPTRYLKQSEKDPLYQRRKLRQKTRCEEDKNSSDESQTATPRSYRKKGLWRKNRTSYQTQLIPLESDSNQIYLKPHHTCCCHCTTKDLKVDILKIEHNSPRESYKAEMFRESLPSCGGVPAQSQDLLEKLASLHNGLMLKQEQWENSPRTPSLSSSTTRN